MNKQKRYLQRQFLRKALAHVHLVLLRNHRLGIEPDVRTALIAGEVIGWLRVYLAKARVAEPIAPDEEQFLEVVRLLKTRKRETEARYCYPHRPRGPKARGRSQR